MPSSTVKKDSLATSEQDSGSGRTRKDDGSVELIDSGLREPSVTLEAQRTYVEHLFQQHRYALLRYLRGLRLNEQDAADVLQDTYVRLLSQPGLDKLKDSSRSYIFVTATNLVRDRLRRAAVRRHKDHSPLEDSGHPSSLPTPDAFAEWGQVLELFKRTVFELRPVTRQIFLLHRVSNMTYPEIASEMDISTRTVERHMSIAMTHFSRKLEGYL